MLKLPATVGDIWDSTPKIVKLGTVTGYKSKVRGEEETELPAGKFKAIRVDSVNSLRGKRYTVSQWYAPGIGLIKQVTEGGDRTQMLKSFRLGK